MRTLEELAKTWHVQVLSALEMVLNGTHETQSKRAAAAAGLGRLGRFDAVLPLIEALGRDRAPILAIVNALGATNDPRAIEPLISRLEAGDRVAARQLAVFSDERVIRALEAALTSRDEGVREYAAESLAAVGTEHSIASLEKLLSDPASRVRETAQQAIDRITARATADRSPIPPR